MSNRDRKPLLRNQGEPSMRNFPLFIFLTALVFFFYVFYLYQAQSTELILVKELYESQVKQLKAIKSELIDTKAELEKVRTSELGLKNDKDDVNSKFEGCQTSLRSVKMRTDSISKEKDKLDLATKEKDVKIAEISSKLLDLERNNTALRSIRSSQDSLMKQLNQTVQLLQEEIVSLKRQDVSPVSQVLANHVGDLKEASKVETLTNSVENSLSQKFEEIRSEERRLEKNTEMPIPMSGGDPIKRGAEVQHLQTQGEANAIEQTKNTLNEEKIVRENDKDGDIGIQKENKPMVKGGDYDDRADDDLDVEDDKKDNN